MSYKYRYILLEESGSVNRRVSKTEHRANKSEPPSARPRVAGLQDYKGPGFLKSGQEGRATLIKRGNRTLDPNVR
jgi:hypothetical protein